MRTTSRNSPSILTSFGSALMILTGLIASPQAFADPLGDALESPALTWTTGGSANWQPQTTTNHDGVDAAQSGDIANSQESYLQTTVTGPGELAFWWKVSSEEDFDYLEFYVDDVLQSGRISGEVDWQQAIHAIATGSHTLKWRYMKDSSATEGTDTGWVDEVTFTPEGPATTRVATNVTESGATLNGGINPGGLATTVTFEYGLTTSYGSTASATLSPNNGTSVQNVSAVITGLLPGTLYHYRVTATNSGGPFNGADRTFTTVSPFLYEVSGGAVTITGYVGTSLIVNIPATITGLPVTRIDDYAFYEEYDLTSITIPSGVTSIGEYAFSECYELTSLIIPASVTSIESGAFSGCEILPSLILPNGITSIASYTFSGCGGLLSMTIPSGVNSIGTSAFSGCESLTSLVLPNGITNIAAYTFNGCSGLTTMTIPSGVTNIASGAFYGCRSMTSVTIPSAVLSVGDSAFEACESLTAAIIPTGVTAIQSSTFSECYDLTSVTLPASVTSIGSYAFSDCTSLVTLTLPAAVTSIGSSAFSNCSALTGVNIPLGVTSIQSSTFDGCVNLAAITLPAGVTGIGSYAFNNCASLTGIVIPAGVTSFGTSTFSDCEKLVSMVIPGGITYLNDSLFSGCTSLTGVTIPNAVTGIGDYAFADCAKLTGVVLPNGVTGIGDGAFQDCAKLTGMVIPAGVTSVNDDTFSRCSSLASVTIPNGVTGIGERAFFFCTSLSTVTIPLGVTYIGEYAFYGCSSLVTVAIPANVADIGDSAFSFCHSLTAITVNSLNTFYSSSSGILFNKTATHLIQCPEGFAGTFTIPNTVTSIGGSAFIDCSKLTGVTIPAGVVTIGSDAFNGCSSLTNVAIPNSVTSIGNNAFSFCANLATVTLPNTLDTIQGGTFSHCGKLTTVSIPASVTMIGSMAFAYCGSLAAITLPVGLDEIGDSALLHCKSLTVVAIPMNVSYIGDDVFAGCSKLTAIDVNSLNKNFSSLAGVLFNKSRTILIKFPEAIAGNYAIPNGVIGIEDSAFRYSRNLTGVTIPGSITFIGSSAFRYCAGLKSVTIPSGVTEIQDNTFSFCTGLIGIVLPDTLDRIDSEAFSGCTALTNITIPENVEEIGSNAFSGADKLTKALFMGDAPPFMGQDAFYPVSSTFSTYHLLSSNGFTSPFWNGYPAAGFGSFAIPDIAVEHPAGTGLVDGGAAVSFGSVAVKAFVSKTFVIKNTGIADLTGLTITKNGTHTADFTITANPTAPVSGPLGTTSFTVKFSPTGAGARSAAIHIASNDPDEGPFDIPLSGAGLAPEISVKMAAELVDGKGSAAFGSLAVNTKVVKTFTIKNLGNGPLTGLAISKTPATTKEYTVGALGATTLASGASTTFSVTFKPSAKGTRAASLKIASNDLDENPFDIAFTGTGTVKAAKSKPSLNKAMAAGTSNIIPSATGASNGRSVKGIDIINGRKYRTITVYFPDDGLRVEVSSNLVDWSSGTRHTTVVLDTAKCLKVRDNKPTDSTAKRYIRLHPNGG